MTVRKEVTCKDTLAIQTHRIMPSHTNSFGNLFGGQLLYFLDNSASISQTRLTNSLSMTSSIDNMNFLKPLPEDRKNFSMPKIVPESTEEKFVAEGYEDRKAERMAQRDLDKILQSKLTTIEPWKQAK